MKWETIASGIGHKTFALWDNGRRLLTLAFNSESKYTRIEYSDEKRAFTLRYEGLFKNRMVMRNEYGVRIGELIAEGENLIALNGEKLQYSIRGGKTPELLIFRESPQSPLAVCQLESANEKGLLPSLKPASTYHCLLLTLSWYLLRVARQEKMPEFAATL